MATYDLTLTIPSSIEVGDILNCPYSGTAKNITLPSGIYKLEVWGAQGSISGGAGGYSVGTLSLLDPVVVYLYAGGCPSGSSYSGGFNGGGRGASYSWDGTSSYGYGGGGGSDIRIGTDSLYARVIVAGGGAGYSNGYLYVGGGLESTAGATAYKATLTSAGQGGSFGQGGSSSTTSISYRYGPAGGGGGWYGGGYGGYSDSSSSYRYYCGGGSGYVYTESTASNYPSGCLLNENYYLTEASTTGGDSSFLNPTGTSETGHSGNGYVRITFIDKLSKSGKVRFKVNGEIKLASAQYIKIANLWKNFSIFYRNRILVVNKPYDERIEYIQNTGTQYIDTGFKPNQNTTVWADMQVTRSQDYGRFFGCVSGESYNSAPLFVADYEVSSSGQAITSTRLYYMWDGDTSWKLTSTYGDMNRHTYKLDKNGTIYRDDVSLLTHTSATFQVTTNLAIFSYMKPSGITTSSNEFFIGKLYAFKIWDGDTLIRDFVPVKKDNKGYLYDKVENKLYGNSGTGSFTLGSVITDDIDPTNFIETRTWHKI